MFQATEDQFMVRKCSQPSTEVIVEGSEPFRHRARQGSGEASQKFRCTPKREVARALPAGRGALDLWTPEMGVSDRLIPLALGSIDNVRALSPLADEVPETK